MKTRNRINRKVHYTIVTIEYDNGDGDIYYVYGQTSPSKEMKKLIKQGIESLPQIECEIREERRTMDLTTFIENSFIINEEGEI